MTNTDARVVSEESQGTKVIISVLWKGEKQELKDVFAFSTPEEANEWVHCIRKAIVKDDSLPSMSHSQLVQKIKSSDLVEPSNVPDTDIFKDSTVSTLSSFDFFFFFE